MGGFHWNLRDIKSLQLPKTLPGILIDSYMDGPNAVILIDSYMDGPNAVIWMVLIRPWFASSL